MGACGTKGEKCPQPIILWVEWLDLFFCANYSYTIDHRGRIPIPPRYREAFARGAVLVQAVDGCLELYTPESYNTWASFVEEQGAHQLKGRRLQRGVFGRSFDVELDNQGRLLIPPRCQQHAGLEGPVIIVGRGPCLEIWSAQRWEAEEALVDQELARHMESMERRK